MITTITVLTKELIDKELSTFRKYFDIVNDIDTSISSIQ